MRTRGGRASGGPAASPPGAAAEAAGAAGAQLDDGRTAAAAVHRLRRPRRCRQLPARRTRLHARRHACITLPNAVIALTTVKIRNIEEEQYCYCLHMNRAPLQLKYGQGLVPPTARVRAAAMKFLLWGGHNALLALAELRATPAQDSLTSLCHASPHGRSTQATRL